MKRLLIIFVFCLNIALGFCQSNPEKKLGSWFTYSGTHKISEKISIHTCSQLWLYEVGDNFNLIFLSSGLNYYISPKLIANVSYGYLDIDSAFNTNSNHTFENRVFEQITYKHTISKLPIDHRFRVEQRFLNTPVTNKTNHRLRYRLGTSIKLDKYLFIRLNNEFFTTLNKGFTTENRFYSALGINISKSNNLQMGYVNRKINGLNLHRIEIGYYIKTNHIKKTKT